MHHSIDSSPNQRKLKSALPALPVSSKDRADLSRAGALRRGSRDSNRIAFFIHGTPGDASDWQRIFELLESSGLDCALVSLDRPGFGRNQSWLSAESWEEQIACFEEILLSDLEEKKELLVVGHSYGAALAVGLVERLASAGRVSGLLLISGVLSPLEKQCRWYHRILLLPLVSAIAPKRYRQSAKEMSIVRRHLAPLDPIWEQLDFPVTLLHGERDTLIPLSNSEYVASRGDKHLLELVRVLDGGHALPRTHPEVIGSEIEKLFSRISESERSER